MPKEAGRLIDAIKACKDKFALVVIDETVDYSKVVDKSTADPVTIAQLSVFGACVDCKAPKVKVCFTYGQFPGMVVEDATSTYSLIINKSEANAFSSTDGKLEAYLKKTLNVSTIVVMGFDKNACVKSSIGADKWISEMDKGALQLGLTVLTCEEVMRSGSGKGLEASWTFDHKLLKFYANV